MISQQKKPKALRVTLWIARVLVALLFVGTGTTKLVTPVATLAAMWPWAGEYPALLRMTGVVDLAGGIGLALSALLPTRPGLTQMAALGCATLMGCAIVFHLSRGEGADTPFNFLLLALALFVFWGHRTGALTHPCG